jgi:uncharacterized membrane protein YoaK (UPF0700 family)
VRTATLGSVNTALGPETTLYPRVPWNSLDRGVACIIIGMNLLAIPLAIGVYAFILGLVVGKLLRRIHVADHDLFLRRAEWVWLGVATAVTVIVFVIGTRSAGSDPFAVAGLALIVYLGVVNAIGGLIGLRRGLTGSTGTAPPRLLDS